jgi:hypothetical protein
MAWSSSPTTQTSTDGRPGLDELRLRRVDVLELVYDEVAQASADLVTRDGITQRLDGAAYALVVRKHTVALEGVEWRS